MVQILTPNILIVNRKNKLIIFKNTVDKGYTAV